ncbi:MAG: Rod binding domain-containing protein [Planctomycetota bacterium]|jgi:Rod binding domain-containing protein
MNTLRLETMSQTPRTAADKSREKAEKVSDQFEAVFVKTFVSSIRQTGSLGGDDGGMFGKGPGADTYASWFDENVSGELARTGGIGIASALLKEMERDGKIQGDPEAQAKKVNNQAERIQRIANGHDLRATMASSTGGINGIL